MAEERGTLETARHLGATSDGSVEQSDTRDLGRDLQGCWQLPQPWDITWTGVCLEHEGPTCAFPKLEPRSSSSSDARLSQEVIRLARFPSIDPIPGRGYQRDDASDGGLNVSETPYLCSDWGHLDDRSPKGHRRARSNQCFSGLRTLLQPSPIMARYVAGRSRAVEWR
jgi:hypothetical protein